jgi:hypothetical protein
VIRLVLLPIAEANACIKLDLPVPFAPRIKSICPTSIVRTIAPVGLLVGIDNENGICG